MVHRDGFWKLEHLSDAQLLESLGKVLSTQRCALAELVAHLAEVDERRIHLEAAYGSLFAYCVARLGMSEDEACRRIELARLARRFPALFAELASGRITLSVALVLKPVLSPSNHLELLSAARGKSIRQARELVAERFPMPDAPSSIRKLPERRPEKPAEPAGTSSPLPSLTACPPLPSREATTLARPTARPPIAASPVGSLRTAAPPVAAPPVAAPPVAAPPVAAPPVASPPVAPPLASAPAQPSAPTFALAAPSRGDGSAPPAARSTIDPLSAGRYRIQFTADAALKQQLERARDLLRHTYPTGDFAPIVSRALELLIDDLLRRRFGARACRSVSSPAPAKAAHTPFPAPEVVARPLSAPPTDASPSARPSHIPRASRRTVLERDGLGCTWVAPDGARCGSQAWLELDHSQPAGKAGSSEPDNLRLLCRSHNQLAAEHAYGREHVERARALRRMRRRKVQSFSPLV